MFRLTRIVVVASILLAVTIGLWPLVAQPGLLASLAGVLAGTAAVARWLPGLATALVLASAYVSYGVVRLIGGPEVAGMPFFLVGFLGLVLGLTSWTEWQARGPWRVPLAWWATSVAVTWPFVAARELGYTLPPSLAIGPIVTAGLLQMSLAIWMDRLLAAPAGAAPSRANVQPGEWRVPLVLSALVTSAAALYQHWVDPTWLSGEPWIRLGRAVGMMGDANPMGVATALWAPLAAATLATSAASTAVGLVVALPLWLAAWASGARTTLILMAAGAAGLTLVATTAVGWSRRMVVAAGVVLTLLVGAGTVMISPRLSPTSPVNRVLQSALPRSGLGAAAYELFWFRDGYGAAAVELIKEHPLLGVGVGRFAGLSAGYAQRITGRPIPPDNAQNLWRQTLVEQGLLGLLPILWLTGLTVMSLIRGRVEGVDLVLRVMLAGLGVSLLVGYPVQDPAIAVTLALLVTAVARAGASKSGSGL